jgi:hypothetical protein
MKAFKSLILIFFIIFQACSSQESIEIKEVTEPISKNIPINPLPGENNPPPQGGNPLPGENNPPPQGGNPLPGESENIFPTIEGNDLNKQKKIVPDDFVEKDLIIIVAFQKWHQSLVDESIENLENNDLDLSHDIIEVPTIRKSSKLQEIYLDGIMRAAIKDDKIRNRTITAYIDKDQFRNSLDIPNEETIYWFLVQKQSKNILAKGSGIITLKDINLIKSS